MALCYVLVPSERRIWLSCMYGLLDYCLWVVILDHWTLWYHCSKDTSVFPGVESPLRELILGVPILSLAVSMLRSWLTSASAKGGLVGHCAGSPYLHPLPIWGPLSCHPCQLHSHPQGPSDCPGVTHVGCCPLPSSHLHPPVLPTVGHH